MKTRIKSHIYANYIRAKNALAALSIPRAKPCGQLWQYEHNNTTSRRSTAFSHIESITLDGGCGSYRYSDGVQSGSTLYCIPTGEERVLAITYNDKHCGTEYIGKLSAGDYKWTAGCAYNGKIYGFPRKSSTLLEIDPEACTAREADIGLDYNFEHHYGGVLCNGGIVYQPPRNGSYVLRIDLNSMTTSRLCIVSGNKSFRFNSSVLHSSGNLYFIPARFGKVIMLSARDNRFYKLSGTAGISIYNAVEASDGNIYAFSADSDRGILKIDTRENRVSIIHTEIVPGAVGTVAGSNGLLYSVIGSGNAVYEYDATTDTVTCVGSVPEMGASKCSGGYVQPDGSIICIPARGARIYVYKFQ